VLWSPSRLLFTAFSNPIPSVTLYSETESTFSTLCLRSLSVVENVGTVDDLFREFPKLSLVALGLLGRPTTSMLVIAGVKDTLVPISDIDLLLNDGDVPKDAWINPKGGHPGRQLTNWTDPTISREVIMPWELRVLA
jgi:esterase FrsA